MRIYNDKMKMRCRELGIYLGKITKEEQLKQFFQRIRPVTTNKELIRIGAEEDGGYLLPDDLEGVTACFSPGVSIESHFEMTLADQGIRSFLADYSVEAPALDHSLFDFEKKFIGLSSADHVMTLDEWVTDKVGSDASDMILQMDIEGAEYEVLCDASSELMNSFRIIIIEFHNLDDILDRHGFQLIDIVFRKLLKYFDIVHVHPNNNVKIISYKGYEIPECMEFTFLNKERITSRHYTEHFPHPLDAKNSLEKPDVELPFCWYKTS